MISIAIPVYNVVVTDLVRSLYSEINKKKIEAEIILIDDFSDDFFRSQNELLTGYCKYIKLEKNIGRANIRNLFVKYANYEYLLFLDCDSLLSSDDFIENYINHIKISSSYVICGGRIYTEKFNDRKHKLSYLYGKKCESKPAYIRKKNPNRSFMSNNFVIKKSVLEEFPFDERITDYGHEDTLLGFVLCQNHITIDHIDNNIINNDVEKNESFLIKTEKALLNLHKILIFIDNKKDFFENITILNCYNNVVNSQIKLKLVKLTFIISKPIIKQLLIKGFVSIKLFDFYKLGFLIQNITPANQQDLLA